MKVFKTKFCFILILSMSFLFIACGGENGNIKSYSDIIKTYPNNIELCKTEAEIIDVNANGDFLCDGSVEYKNNKTLLKYYGTKITLGIPLELDGQEYSKGTKLTVDKNMEWIEVSSWK